MDGWRCIQCLSSFQSLCGSGYGFRISLRAPLINAAATGRTHAVGVALAFLPNLLPVMPPIRGAGEESV
jgi:hypothetical protein